MRIIEVPTLPGLARGDAFFGDTVELPEDAVMVLQPRTCTSPIWPTPGIGGNHQ